jgi:hypothetical protein
MSLAVARYDSPGDGDCQSMPTVEMNARRSMRYVSELPFPV